MYSLDTLQFEKLLELFARHCKTAMGFRRFEELEPYAGILELKRELTALEEAFRLQEEDAVWFFGELPDPGETLATLGIADASLPPVSLLEIAEILAQALRAKTIIASHRELAPTLFSVVELIPQELSALAESIKKKVLPTGEIDDSASPGLRRIRREINAMRGRLTKSLEAIMRKKSKAVQDEIVTVRNGRFVIPVKSDHSGSVKGVAHGASSSGATVFIEPLESIEANNELQSLKAAEEAETARILFSLANDARSNLDGIRAAVEAVGELDFIKAKTVFAARFNAVTPNISEDLSLELVDARHPLLEESFKKEGRGPRDDGLDPSDTKPETQNSKPHESGVVPSTISLSDENRVMIISGANAGGKTVVLKTAGLLSLMAISGLPTPASKATVPFYGSVLADIGDHQSIAANLSTFSSHVSNIASMMEKMRQPGLVLLDEVGTGTDPDEGSALGVAIVDHFRQKGAQLIASTHYKGLKTYAANDESVINASVEFDEKTLEPTYRLMTGIAGASSGLEIAHRFGISKQVIETARAKLDSASQEAAEYLRRLQDETRQARDLRMALEDEREATAERYSKLDVEFHKKEISRSKAFEDEIERVVSDFEVRTRQILRQIKDKKEKRKIEKLVAGARSKVRREADEAVEKSATGSTRSKKGAAKVAPASGDILLSDEPVAEGADVRLKLFGTIGKVEKIEKDSAHVVVGSLRMKQKLSDLERVKTARGKRRTQKKPAKKAGAALDTAISERSDARELNLIGMTTLEAEDEVDRFLDDSYAAKIMRVRIIHGHGTGALRNAVQKFLKGHPHVGSFGFAPQNEGGRGATIVELKN